MPRNEPLAAGTLVKPSNGLGTYRAARAITQREVEALARRFQGSCRRSRNAAVVDHLAATGALVLQPRP